MNRRSSYDYDELLACGRGELFGAGNAQLPLPPMLMFDRIAEIAEVGGEHNKGMVRAVLETFPGAKIEAVRELAPLAPPSAVAADVQQLDGDELGDGEDVA